MMIQQQRFRLPLIGMILLGLLVGVGVALAMAARKQGETRHGLYREPI